MSRPTVRIIDGPTGEHIDRPMTDAEFAQYEVDQETRSARQDELDAQQAAKTSARTKLKALGLTDDEIAALIP